MEVLAGPHSFLETPENNSLRAPGWPNLVPPPIFHAASSTCKLARAQQVLLALSFATVFPSLLSSATSQRKFSALKGSRD